MTGITLQTQTFGARSIPGKGRGHAAKVARDKARDLAGLTKGLKTLNAGQRPAVVGAKSSFVAKA